MLVCGLLVLRLCTLGAAPIFDPSEGRYAEIAREMVVSGDWVTPKLEAGLPFWGKPPLHAWLVAASYEMLGFTEFAARLPSFMCLLVVVGFAMLLARTWYGWITAWWSAAILISTPLVYMTSAVAMIDIVLTACLASFWSCIALASGRTDARGRHALTYVGFVFVGLALLAKGPVALALVGVFGLLWMLLCRTPRCVTSLPWLTGSLVAILVAAPWYVLAELRTPGFLRYFLVNENLLRFLSFDHGDQYGKGHPYPFASIWGLWLLAALPWSLFLAWRGVCTRVWTPSVWRQLQNRPTDALVLAWLLTPMVLFTPCRNIVITYVLPGLMPLAIVVGRIVARMLEAQERRSSSVLQVSSLLVPLLACGGVLFVSRKAPLSTMPAMLAMACLAGIIVAGIGLQFRRRKLMATTAFACLVVPLVATILVGCIADGLAREYSAKHVVAALKQDPSLRGRPVASYKDAYSGQFYTCGRMRSLHEDPGLLRAFCDGHPDWLVAFRPKDLSRLPLPLRDRFHVCRDLHPVVLCSSDKP